MARRTTTTETRITLHTRSSHASIPCLTCCLCLPRASRAPRDPSKTLTTARTPVSACQNAPDHYQNVPVPLPEAVLTRDCCARRDPRDPQQPHPQGMHHLASDFGIQRTASSAKGGMLAGHSERRSRSVEHTTHQHAQYLIIQGTEKRVPQYPQAPQEWHTQVALPFVKIVGTTVEWDE